MSVASIGECMLELSGSDGRNWRMGFAGDTFNTLWTLRALTDMPCDYVSAFGDDPFSTQQIAFMAEAGIGVAGRPSSRERVQAFTRSRSMAPSAHSHTGVRTRRRDGLPTIQRHSRPASQAGS